MPPIMTGNFAKLLWPGINAIYGDAYKEHTPEYPALFDFNTSSKNYEEDVGTIGFGLARIKREGSSITYDTQQQGYISRYTHVTYALGFVITREMYEDKQYARPMLNRATALSFSMRQTKEIVGANVYNRAFTGAYAGGDGKEMCADDHPNVSGGTWANELSTPADLSEEALEQAVIDISLLENDRGLQIAVLPQKLIIPSALQFEAERILKSTLQNDTANNAINALRSKGMFSQGYDVNHYLSDTKAWFIRTNCPNGLKYFQRRADDFQMDNDFDTENAKYKASARYSFKWTDPRGVFGSAGA